MAVDTMPKVTKRVVTRNVEIPSEQRILRGILTVPLQANGVIAFAHGSVSARPRQFRAARPGRRIS